MEPSIKVGDIIWYRVRSYHRVNRSYEDWAEETIIGETPRSWLIKGRWDKKIPVNKQILSAAPTNPSHDNSRTQYFTTVQKEELIACEEWLAEWQEPIQGYVRSVGGYHTEVKDTAFLKKLLKFLQDEGIEIKPKEIKQ